MKQLGWTREDSGSVELLFELGELVLETGDLAAQRGHFPFEAFEALGGRIGEYAFRA